VAPAANGSEVGLTVANRRIGESYPLGVLSVLLAETSKSSTMSTAPEVDILLMLVFLQALKATAL
jgi:hypothetical protein